MFGLSDAHHFRKMVAGFCMVFAPLCMLVGFLVDPDAEYAFLFAGTVLMVPAMLGLVAPVGGALYDRLGARLLTASGMLICVIGLALLFMVMDGTHGSLLPVMLALAIFGIGQGLFISPNNSAIMAAAPVSLTGEAGGLLNVMRSLGISVGVAAASSLLAWRLAVLTGSGYNTLAAEGRHLLAAGRDVIVLLGSFVAAAGALSLTRTSPPPSRAPTMRLE